MALGVDALPFVAALAKDATDFVALVVFADWLEEHGQTALGARFRRLMPQTGDLLVYRVQDDHYAEQLPRARDVANIVQKNLREGFGVETYWLILPEDMELQQVDEATMRELGWVRAPQEGVPEG
jgi:uncharacterized protein (TIGR02996 family)